VLTMGTKRRTGRGFSLVELMFVVAIGAILAMVAIPSYTRYVQKNARAQGKARLVQAAQNLERFYTDNNSYFVDVSGGNLVVNTAGSTVAGFVLLMRTTGTIVYSGPNNEATSPYTVALATADANSFMLTATPRTGSPQAGDMCGNLTLTSTGVKGIASLPAGSTATLADCW